MTTDDPQDRDDRFRELAYQQGRRDADVDARLLSHERRLNAINGSIEKTAVNAAKLERTIHGTREALEGKIDSLIAAQTARAAVETDREKRSSNGFTRFQTWALYLGVLAAILAPFISHWLS